MQDQLSSDGISATTTSTSSPSTLNEVENVLIDHFTTYTCLTLAADEKGQHIWSNMVPSLAYQHEFLMHALLACSALHMASFSPKSRFELITKARIHQGYAMPLFRGAVLEVDNENCDSVLTFARLIAINTFALADQSIINKKEDHLPDWLFFSRSGCKYFSHISEHIASPT